MRLRLRLLWLMLASLWRSPLGARDESVLTLTVLPTDVDISKISDDRFLALMDLGRMDLAFRIGLLRVMFRRGWVPLATFATIRFRHPLRLFQRYRLRTRAIYWDDDTVYFQQVFERKGRIVATGYVCATLLGLHGRISPKDLLAEIHESPTPPDKPEIVARLQELNDMIHDTQKERD